MKRPNKLAAAKEILSMAMETVSAAGGNIEVMFLQQVGNDPFTPTLERAAQTSEVASRIARFISEARATLDIAIYDFQLRDDAAAIMTDALRERANNNVVIRIIYDAHSPILKGITGYRVLMHNKYIVRDGNSAEAAV